MGDKIELSLKNGQIEVDVNYEDITNLVSIIAYLQNHKLMVEIIKSKCRTEDLGKINNSIALFGYTKPVIKPSEFK